MLSLPAKPQSQERQGNFLEVVDVFITLINVRKVRLYLLNCTYRLCAEFCAFFFFSLYLCMHLGACLNVHPHSRRGHQIPCDELKMSVSHVGVKLELGTTGRASRALNHWAISSAPSSYTS